MSTDTTVPTTTTRGGATGDTTPSAWRRLLRMQLRRDRLLLTGWVGGGIFLYVSQAKSIDQMYPTQGALDTAANTMAGNAAMIAMTGPARALDSLGGQVAWQSAAYGAVVAGLMSMLIVIRHTRLEEETGRSELVRAGAVGRLTPLVTAVGLAFSASLLLGALVALSLVGYGLPGEGSWALGAALAAAGCVFAGVAAVAAQVTVSARTAYAITSSVIGAAFFVRAIGDTGPQALSWASPIGWGQFMRSYAGERWWPLALSLVAALSLLGLAVWLHDRRDHAASLWTPRDKPSRDTRLGAWSLVWRLHRSALVGWAAAVSLVGLGYGAMAEAADDILGSSEFTNDVFATGSAPVEGFLATGILVLALLCSACGVMGAQRPDAEERAGRLDTLMAGRLPRVRWSLQHAVTAAAGASALLLLSGLATGAGHALASGETDYTSSLVQAAAAYIPAVLTVIATAHVAHGLGWSASLAGWALVGWCAFVGMFGQLMELPAALTGVSPLDHVAAMPLETFDGRATSWLTAVGLALLVVAHALLRRRDLT